MIEYIHVIIVYYVPKYKKYYCSTIYPFIIDSKMKTTGSTVDNSHLIQHYKTPLELVKKLNKTYFENLGFIIYTVRESVSDH